MTMVTEPTDTGDASRPVRITDLIGDDDSAEIELEPDRLGLTARTSEL
ncbi:MULTISPECIES: hypothetical protein [Tsukamurella]|uniref:Uncharacterized protein n=1 Tax=Tsukamurella columbiensis TaxID=128509 RepID=A0ABX1L881_9ACTN|nr:MULTISPECIES: hypothetical protein [Tsukamurella]NMD54392.1 hypothetical protein [Tsukamurella columbiensis]